ncbi:Hypothetical protein I595_640 [Croceitalea dokdonensis DOKDO 023]|uniref:Uncharacterized protein n=1 Tax=Croceitalea dokdonensis DOKDO 023 TaxID=1300341 RepID=A0A0P7ANX3_9FLAO|nr:Hypothetical protein I595_640 [Croceitalea dokdonensis DOKDO 023]
MGQLCFKRINLKIGEVNKISSIFAALLTPPVWQVLLWAVG